ncbi:SHOCT domain-containing protein [Tateyamaria pelophila]|uniref:SHOCT domain-containing protein n=1 Tax=Tateyamaria pelophila TaxID=328415 RepID=UPI001CBD7528|nr:SHOCT domain-containing protein [Tateyamaria pelophila]
MTAILDDMRRLDAAHARGEITAAELAKRKARLLDAVPEVLDVLDVTPVDVPPRRAPARRTRPGIGQALLLCALILTVCIGVTLLLTNDVMLSATLAITVLAACTVMLFLQLDG